MKKIMLVLAAALFTFTGCMVKDEVYKGPTSIDKVAFEPAAPTSITPVTVTATVSGLQKVTKATLTYNGTDVEMTGNGTTYTGTIPAQADGTEVKFKVTVVNEAELTTVSEEYTYKVGDPATDWTKLKLNELSGAGSDEEKYIELYNDSDFPIKLTGVTIAKDEAYEQDKLAWTGNSENVIPAKGFFVLVGAKGTTPNGFATGFSPKKNVLMELFAPDGTRLDYFQRGEKGEKGWGNTSLDNNSGSWSRIPDGTGAWKKTDTLTPGAANAADGTADPDVK